MSCHQPNFLLVFDNTSWGAIRWDSGDEKNQIGIPIYISVIPFEIRSSSTNFWHLNIHFVHKTKKISLKVFS